MTHAERVAVLREFLDTPVLGIPLVWYIATITIACVACMVWIAVDGYRKQHKRRKFNDNST